MPRFVAFLRAVNVGGRNVTMEAMRARFEKLGFAKVESFIASGNVIFEAQTGDARSVERKIETGLAESLGWEVTAFVRTDAEVAAIARSHPFSTEEMKLAAAFNVLFLAEPLEGSGKMERFRTAIDDFRVEGREIYWLCRKKQSESTFSNNAFERALKVRATFRGMKTVQKLAAKYPPDSGRAAR